MEHSFLARRVVVWSLGLIFLATCPAPAKDTAKRQDNGQAVALRVDPLLIAQAAEVWKLIGSPKNPIWPRWDASKTPLLIYLPGQQDVLINHPNPPEGFLPYRGLAGFPGARVAVKNGPTIIDVDGQNTSKDIAGVRTLVVADTLSNMRSRIAGLLEATTPAAEKIQALSFSDFATDPYSQLELVVHEAFHVYQHTQAPGKAANEMLLLQYPVLSVQNNVGFAQEGPALVEAVRSSDAASLRRAAVRWLAIRKDRRASLPPKAVEYEDACEFGEGLAKYTGFRLFEVLEGRSPGAAMSLAQGFDGYADLAPRRDRLVQMMLKHMRGEVVVNNDPYGTGPVRMRLYYSGMAVGVILDRLSLTWKERIFLPGVSLTSLVEEALRPSQAELDQALQNARSDPAYATLLATKTKLAADGQRHAEAMLNEIETGPGTALVVDYSGLESPKVGMSFTPFGITKIDGERTIFSLVPVKVVFGDEGEVTQKIQAPLLRDNAKRLIQFRLPGAATRAEIEKALNKVQTSEDGTVSHLALEFPGAAIKANRARITWSGENLIIALLKPDEKK